MTTKALVCRPNGENRLSLEDVPLPSPQPTQILTRILTAAQNPTDIKSFDMNRFGAGAMLGCDFCGLVEEVGSKVTRFGKGDRIAGLLMRKNP